MRANLSGTRYDRWNLSGTRYDRWVFPLINACTFPAPAGSNRILLCSLVVPFVASCCCSCGGFYHCNLYIIRLLSKPLSIPFVDFGKGRIASLADSKASGGGDRRRRHLTMKPTSSAPSPSYPPLPRRLPMSNPLLKNDCVTCGKRIPFIRREPSCGRS